MRFSPIVLLLFAMLGCGSGTQPAKPSGKAPAEETPATAPKPAKVVPNNPKAKAVIEARIRWAAGKPAGELTKTDLEKVTRLVFPETQITDLKLLTGLTKLTELYLEHNQITDLTPLAGLTELWWLRLDSNQITDLTPLAGMTKLEHLFLEHNQITDLKPLVGLTKLERLFLTNNQITNLKPLVGLTKLEELDLGNNQITDLKPLAGLTKLERLFLDNNQITDLKPLAGLKRLGILDSLYTLPLYGNPNLTRVEIDKLRKALPRSRIRGNDGELRNY